MQNGICGLISGVFRLSIHIFAGKYRLGLTLLTSPAINFVLSLNSMEVSTLKSAPDAMMKNERTFCEVQVTVWFVSGTMTC